LSLSSAFPYPGLNERFADCRQYFPKGLEPGLLDQNARCIWADYQVKHDLPVDPVGLDLFDGQYENVLERQFFEIARRYPAEVLRTFFSVKPQMILETMATALHTNFAGNPKLTAVRDDPNYTPYSALALALLIAALAVGMLHLAIAGTTTSVVPVAAAGLLATAFTLPPYIVAWPAPPTIADLTFFCVFLAGVAYGAVVATARWLVGRSRRSQLA